MHSPTPPGGNCPYGPVADYEVRRCLLGGLSSTLAPAEPVLQRGGSQLSEGTSEGSDQAALRHLRAGLGLQPGRAHAVFGRIHRMIELGLIIDEDDDLPPLEEVVGAAHEASRREGVD